MKPIKKLYSLDVELELSSTAPCIKENTKNSKTVLLHKRIFSNDKIEKVNNYRLNE